MSDTPVDRLLKEGLFADKFRPTAEEVLKNLYDLYIYYDGRFVKGSEATVYVWDHAFLYGEGVFEGIREYNGNIFKLDEHMERLWNSAHGVDITIPLTVDEMKQAIIATLRVNWLKEAHIRPIVTRGVGGPGLDPRSSKRSSVIIMTYPMPPLLGEKPTRLLTSTVRRKSPFSIDPKLKSLNYLDNILAKLQAIKSGYQDAVMLDLNGFIAEGTGENLFIVKKSKLFTPLTEAALPGITRQTVFDMAKEMGLEAREQNLTLHELYNADEAFGCGTGAEISPIGEVDGRIIGKTQPGPITMEIMKRYKKLVHEKYLTPVY